MKSATLFSLLSIVTISYALPLDGTEHNLIQERQTGEYDGSPPAAGASSAAGVVPSATVAARPGAYTEPAAGMYTEPAAPGSFTQPAGSASYTQPAEPASYSPPVELPAASPVQSSAATGSPDSGSPSSPVQSPAASGGPDSSSPSSGTGSWTAPSAYKLYTGDGSATAGWPTEDQWIPDFDAMFTALTPLMKSGCPAGVAQNSDEEIGYIKVAITAQSVATKVDKRHILATVVQESKGCVRVPTTNGGVVNPGLMQSHAGSSCTSNPCNQDIVTKMIADGTAGTSQGPGLQGCLATAVGEGSNGAQAVYWASRIYNTGSYTRGSDLGKPVDGTACYASDIANTLTGVIISGDTPCKLTIS